MGKDRPGVRDGTGAFKGSWQAERFNEGKRKQTGEECPYEEDFEIKPEIKLW